MSEQANSGVVAMPPTLSPEDVARVKAHVEQHGRLRLAAARQLGVKGKALRRAEFDFLSGAMAVYDALGVWKQVPPHWLVAMLSGRPILDAKEDR